MLDSVETCGGLLIREIPWIEPAAAFQPFADDPHVAWLDSAPGYGRLGRYSYIAVAPFKIMSPANDPFGAVATELAKYRLPPGIAPAPFAGGAVGFFGYGLARHLEVLPNRHGSLDGLPDMVLGFYDLVLAFDHQENRAWIFSSGFPELEDTARQARATARMAATLQRLYSAPGFTPIRAELVWRAELDRSAYEARVHRVLDCIRAGDIFQANFTMRFMAERPAGLAAPDIFRALRHRSPAAFGAYLGCGEGFALASASPERFIALNAQGKIETRPVKGTARRGASLAEDERLSAALQSCPKNRAENLMIVDLMRSDIGRVAELGSVKVEALCSLESHANLHHLVSVVTGQLRPGLGAIDVLRATFPGGSVTGAPKVRAMEIIDEMEVAPRGAYCGAIAWIGFDGAMDSSIIIRTLTITPKVIIAQAGGGIVADSDPAEEYAEMLLKIQQQLSVFYGGYVKLWLNGKLLETSEARLDPADRGFTLGDGVFETVRVAGGRPVRLPQHLHRLQYGAGVLEISWRCDATIIADSIGAILLANDLQDAALRITLTRGPAARGVLPRDTNNPTLLIACAILPAPRLPAHAIISRITCRNETSPLSRIKSLNYLDNILALQDAVRQGADEAILLNTKGQLAEASAANIFIIRGEHIVTPPVADGALPGIMRTAIMARFDAVEKSIAPSDLQSAQAMFLSNALGLRAVTQVDDISLDVQHPLLKKIMQWAAEDTHG